MISNSKQISDYFVYKDAGNASFIDLVCSLWTPDNPKGINHQSMCWVMCSYLCYYLFCGCSTKVARAQSLCETLIYGWSKPIDKNLYVNFYWAEEYMGISHDISPLNPSISFSEIEKGFNPGVWQKLKPFLCELSEVSEIEDVGDYFMGDKDHLL